MTLKVLFFGDIVGRIGRKAIKKIIPELKKEYEPDLVIANGENLAHGVGITEKTLNEMKEAGIDFFTSGNHIFRRDGAQEVLSSKEASIIRPANYPPGVPGQGVKILNIGLKKVLMVNLLGRVFMGEDRVDCPFRKFDEIFKEYENKNYGALILDFHGEATSEKVAMGHYVDGRATAVLGTHTHIPTADQRILPKGTAYVSDTGMVGALNSVIGVNKENVLKMFLTQMPLKHEIPEEGMAVVNGIYLEIDTKSKKRRKLKEWTG